jgi:uncharacterized protein YaaN involved in tellurite resistance
MSENNNQDQNQVQAQVQQPVINLTLNPQEEIEKAEQASQPEEVQGKTRTIEEMELDAKLTDQEKAAVDAFSKKIDVTDTDSIISYGSAAQKKVSDFSDTTLKNIQTKDLGEIGNMLSNLVSELKDVGQEEEKKGILGFFKKQGDKIENYRIRYDKAEANVDKIAKALEEQQIVLMKDVQVLDQLYEKNATNTKELSMYIIAGKKKLAEIRDKDLKEATDKARKSGLPEDAQAANDLAQACDRFEKKLYDLELTRQISIQMAPQIRLVQNNDTLMIEKIQSTLVNTIPLWKNQIVLALGINHSKEAMEAQREVNNMTNEMLKKNAETLHQATVDTAKESERGIVDLETLQHTNEELIATLDEVMNIQKDGRAKRQAAEVELNRIEKQLNDRLLQYQTDTDVTQDTSAN